MTVAAPARSLTPPPLGLAGRTVLDPATGRLHRLGGRADGPQTQALARYAIAAVIAVGFNLAVVLVLAQVSHRQEAPPPTVLALHRVRDLTPPPPPATPPPAPTDTTVAPVATPVVPLPPLDLPTAGPATGLALPAIDMTGADLALPLAVPAFAAIAVPVGDAPAVAGPPGPPAFDTPAEREGDFDLARFYPGVARMRRITGDSRVRIAVGADGRVQHVEVLESTPPGVFDRATERLAQSLRFRPATRGGVAVPSVIDTRIQWTLR